MARAKDYIAAGDIFQVVLSHRFAAPWSGDPFAFYRSLRRRNPSPYLFFLDFEGHVSDARVKRALSELEQSAVRLEVLGSYPRSEPLD